MAVTVRRSSGHYRDPAPVPVWNHRDNPLVDTGGVPRLLQGLSYYGGSCSFIVYLFDGRVLEILEERARVVARLDDRTWRRAIDEQWPELFDAMEDYCLREFFPK